MCLLFCILSNSEKHVGRYKNPKVITFMIILVSYSRTTNQSIVEEKTPIKFQVKPGAHADEIGKYKRNGNHFRRIYYEKTS
ncbi:hypothetical protein FB479_111132 [Brevibacillus sp. AG162]|nr:hypothetical protein FB479_111132 [Brevibacillus sp. AG162]